MGEKTFSAPLCPAVPEILYYTESRLYIHPNVDNSTKISFGINLHTRIPLKGSFAFWVFLCKHFS